MKITFLSGSTLYTSKTLALEAINALSLSYAEPVVAKYTESEETKYLLCIGTGSDSVIEIGTYASIEAIQNQIGNLSSLTTTNKENLVAAINELKAAVDSAVAGGVNSITAGDGISVDDTTTTSPKVSVKLGTDPAEGTKNILVFDSEKGVYATVDLAYDGSTGNLTLTGSNGLTKTINIPVDNFVKSGSYDPSTNSLILVLQNDEEITIPVDGLIEEWTVANTQTLELERDKSAQPSGSIVLKGNVKISATEGNQLTTNSDGLFVPAVDLSSLTTDVNQLKTDVQELQTNVGNTLTEVEAGNAITVTAKAGQKQTIAVDYDNVSIGVGTSGKLKVLAVSGGTF